MKTIVVLAFSALCSLSLGAFGILEVSKARCYSLVGDVTCRVATNQRLVALTFDDGPTEIGVDTLLPLLDQFHAKGTFFLIGRMADSKLVGRIVAAGHEVGNHSFRHERMIFRSSSLYDQEIREADAALVRAGAPRSTLFHPPFGKNLIGLPLAAQRAGKRIVMWNSGDAPDRDPRVYAQQVIREVRPGSIILVHAMYSTNATERAALPIILSALSERGYRIVTVSQLLAASRR